jgi:hypothetical protein
VRKAKPWQVVLVVAALVVACVSVVVIFRGKSPVTLSDELTLVDVTTGELWTVSVKGRGVGIPATNPETGVQSLISAFQDEQGRWIAGSRDMKAVGHLGIKPAAVDPKTGEIRVAEGKPKRLRLGGG